MGCVLSGRRRYQTRCLTSADSVEPMPPTPAILRYLSRVQFGVDNPVAECVFDRQLCLPLYFEKVLKRRFCDRTAVPGVLAMDQAAQTVFKSCTSRR